MGFIKEPTGVDFIIKSDPLTDEERKAISQFISTRKKSKLAKGKKRLKAKQPSKISSSQ